MKKSAPTHLRVPVQFCPFCGTALDCVSQEHAPATPAPQPGDETLCFRCATVLVFGPHGDLAVEPQPEISADALAVQVRLKTFLRQYPRRGEAP